MRIAAVTLAAALAACQPAAESPSEEPSPSDEAPESAEGTADETAADEGSSNEEAATGEPTAATDEMGTNEAADPGAVVDGTAEAGEAEAELVAITSVSGQHIAGLSPGANRELVRDLLGEPARVEADGIVFDATGTTFAAWHYPDRGLTVTVEGAPDAPEWHVAFLVAEAPYDGTLPCGLRIGSTEAEARQVLGDELRIMDEEKWATLGADVEDGVVVRLAFAQMGE